MGFDSFNLGGIPPQFIALLVVWDLFWKGVGLWYAIQNKQRNWFIAMFVLNTFGILPIVYIKFFQSKQK